ncbi:MULTISPECIES: RNA ligase family protein [Haloferacaceae]|uniref:RNA ligase family protein n=1 Tax=Halorubrum glutamatedens TaxID=2707018 RepID=A0ABD5QQR2_9EURY|nr:RNA ligase family protein [Halobellus captivus]
MKRYPPIPTVAGAPDDLLTGHLWLLELIDGPHLRFRMDESGLIRFGDRDAVYDDPDELPAAYRHAARHVRQRFDREALRNAVEDVADVVFFGVATSRRGTEYDWDRTPSFLGHDVWSADAGAFRPPDAAEAIFERLGLDAVNAVERERRARDFDPEAYTVPSSAWYDGPAAGVVVRNKTDGRGVIRTESDVRGGSDTGVHRDNVTNDVSPADAAVTYGSDERLRRIATRIEDHGHPVTVGALAERAFEAFLRERHQAVSRDGEGSTGEAVRSELIDRARVFLDDDGR